MGKCVPAALVALILIVYAPAWHYGFLQYDDPLYVTKNAEVARGLTLENVRWAFTTNHAASWHPLTWLSHMADVHLFGMDAGRHHLTSILLHICNSLLLFWLLLRMTQARWPSALVAALFALHPLHVESVVWIAERKDVLSTLFWMLTLHAYVHYARSLRRHRYPAVLAAFALGLMSKSMLVTVPFVLLLLDIWPLGRIRLEPGKVRTWIRPVCEKLPLLAMAGAASAITFAVQLKGGTVLQLEQYPLTRRMTNALVSYGTYIINAVWPGHLAAFYPFEPVSGLLAAACAAGLILVTVLAIRYARRFPFLLTGWLLYLITLGPVIGLIQVGNKARADRFTYVPLIGIFIIAAWGIPKILERWRQRTTVLTAAAAVLLCAYTAAARNQVGYWQSDRTLWEHTVRVTGDNYFARHNLGMALLEQGEVDDAAANFVEALRINPASAETHNALSDVLLKQGRPQDALAEATEALRLKARYAEAHSNRGFALAGLGRVDDAIAEFHEALAIEPGRAEIHFNLAFALEETGRHAEAVAQLQEALKINPAYAEACNKLGNIYFIADRLDAAEAQYRKALELKPEFADARNNLGYLLMTRNRYDEAIAHLGEAVRINPDFALAHNNLGLTLVHLERTDEAIAHFREAVRIQPGWTYAMNNLAAALAK